MSKYRGTVEGKQRGEYRSVQLQATFDKKELARMRGTEVWPHTPFDDFDAYLKLAGTSLDRHCVYDKPHKVTSGTYHYGGAIVHVEYVEFKEDERHEGELTVKLVSNDPLDDAIERLCRKFPCLKMPASTT